MKRHVKNKLQLLITPLFLVSSIGSRNCQPVGNC